MTLSDFYSEVVNNGIAPRNFDIICEEFRVYQNVALNTLRVFHDICEKHNIHYQLAFGSLLGAVRDKGQIPWDYDIDVFVPYEEKTKMISAIINDLNGLYYYMGPELNPKCPRSIGRLCPVGYNSDVMHLDIFYLLGSSNDEIERQHAGERLRYIQSVRYSKFTNPIKYSHGNIKQVINLTIRKIKVLGINWSALSSEFEEICSRYPLKAAPFAQYNGINSHKRLFPISDIGDTILLNTVDGVFRVASGYENILRSTYGDYNKYLSCEQRLFELLSNYYKLKKYAKD